MVEGFFIEDVPFVRVIVASEYDAQAAVTIVDTGFSGDLQITPEMASELRLETIGTTKARIANGETVRLPVALALAAMEGETQQVEVTIVDSMPLAGIGLFSKFGYTAIVDCKDRVVTLEK